MKISKGMTVGLGFILVPIVIITGYVSYQWLFTEVVTHTKMAVKSPIFGFDAAPTPTNPTAQVLIGAGTCFMSVCYGVAKIIREIRRT
jgi:hypothetical protein